MKWPVTEHRDVATACPDLDHVVYATPDLDLSVRDLRESLRIEPSPGGRHLGRGTRNYLMSLGRGSYLEIIGRDPLQTDFEGMLPFGLDGLSEPRLVGWALRVDGIEPFVDQVQRRGYDPGRVESMSRRTPDGFELHWKLTRVSEGSIPALVPFLIDWGDTPHPSGTSAQGAVLESFRLEDPNPARIRTVLDALGVAYPVDKAASLRLIAHIAGKSGMVMLS